MGTGIYTRVSTNKQEEKGVSLETQLEKLQAYCMLKDLENTKEYTDVGTGRNVERSGFKQMMKDVKSGRIKNIVVFRLDRLTRSVSDLNILLKKLEKYECGLHSATESLDTSTANGRLMVNLIGVLAQWESETISERVTVNMDALSKQGVWMGSAPYGFYLGSDRRLKTKKKEADILREAFELVLDGESFTSAERFIMNKHGIDWGRGNFLARKARQSSTVGDTFRNGEVTEDTHEGIITRAEQKKLITIMEQNLTGRRNIKHDDIFRRRVVCYQCTKIMSVNAKTTNDYKTINYSYVCVDCENGSFVSVAESLLEKAFTEHMKSLSVSNFEEIDERQDDAAQRIKYLKGRLDAQISKRDKTQRAWISDMISDDDFKAYKNEFDEVISSLEKEIQELSNDNDVLRKDVVAELVFQFNTLFDNLDRDEKRAFVQRHVKKIWFSRFLKKGYSRRYDIEVVRVDFF